MSTIHRRFYFCPPSSTFFFIERDPPSFSEREREREKERERERGREKEREESGEKERERNPARERKRNPARDREGEESSERERWRERNPARKREEFGEREREREIEGQISKFTREKCVVIEKMVVFECFKKIVFYEHFLEKKDIFCNFLKKKIIFS